MKEDDWELGYRNDKNFLNRMLTVVVGNIMYYSGFECFYIAGEWKRDAFRDWSRDRKPPTWCMLLIIEPLSIKTLLSGKVPINMLIRMLKG